MNYVQNIISPTCLVPHDEVKRPLYASENETLFENIISYTIWIEGAISAVKL